MHQNNLKSKSQIKEENYMRFYCKKYLVFTQTIYILFFYLLGLPLFRPISFVEQGQGQFQLSLLPSFHASFLPCFLPSMLPSFHASFLPSLLLSFPPFCFFINANGKCMFVLMQIYGFFVDASPRKEGLAS